MPQVAPMDNDNGTAERQQELNRHRLQVKLDRLLRVKDELWEECQPVPRELEDKIREVRQALDRG
ncbi:unnamed protein product [Gemmataceae bacterium]|nr:unnamed protein product [Gemmataceae bacterium]VTU00156.1 unnamed protein product [Gemmataceae bacterium]